MAIYNATGAAVDLVAGRYQLEIYFNGETTTQTRIDLEGTVAPGRVFVLADEDATDPQANGSSIRATRSPAWASTRRTVGAFDDPVTYCVPFL